LDGLSESGSQARRFAPAACEPEDRPTFSCQPIECLILGTLQNANPSLQLSTVTVENPNRTFEILVPPLICLLS
jgi:hypothetical protein